ncbi:unnamed protein product, partial [Meganyctiphanes norvegica]
MQTVIKINNNVRVGPEPGQESSLLETDVLNPTNNLDVGLLGKRVRKNNVISPEKRDLINGSSFCDDQSNTRDLINGEITRVDQSNVRDLINGKISCDDQSNAIDVTTTSKESNTGDVKIHNTQPGLTIFTVPSKPDIDIEADDARGECSVGFQARHVVPGGRTTAFISDSVSVVVPTPGAISRAVAGAAASCCPAVRMKVHADAGTHLLQEGVSVSAARSSSLRHSKTNGSTHTSLESRPSTGEPPPRKSNWEVIEHYHKSGLVGASSPKNPPEEEEPKEEVESILQERSSWWDMCGLCKQVFRSHQFKNIHVEVLYQRYFLRMNQSNLTSLLGLLIVVVLLMLVLNYLLNVTSSTTMHAIFLGVFALVYILLEILLAKLILLNEVYLIIFSYVILISFFGMELLIVLSSEPHTASAGVWATLFFIYMTYTLLPLRIPEATIGGLLLSVAQIACAAAHNADDAYLWKQ